MNSEKDIEALRNGQPVVRAKTILTIAALEKLTPESTGVELNEGYDFFIDGAIPQVADGIAKMAFEMDKLSDMGDNAGGAFISLVVEYYQRLKGGE